VRVIPAEVVFVVALTVLTSSATAKASVPPDGSTCVIKSSQGGFGGTEGIVTNGQCQPLPTGPNSGGDTHDGPAVRTVICARPAGSGSGPPIADCIAPSDCPDGVAWTYEELIKGQWIPIGPPWCPQGGNAPPPPPSVGQIRQQVLRLLPHVEIGSAPHGAGLANAETVLWADTGTNRRLPTVAVVGQQVELRIGFDHASWNFGDGRSDTTSAPGRPYDDQGDPCETAQCADYYGHTYTATGTVTVTLTVAWHAQYRLAGQGWTDVGAAPLTGPARSQTLTIRQARGVLIH
jgi:hypothetical protein